MTDSEPRVAWLTSDIASVGGKATVGGCAYYRCYLPMRSIGVPGQMIGKPAWTAEHGFGLVIPGGKARIGFSSVMLKLLWNRSLAHQISCARDVGQHVVVDIDDLYEDLDERNVASEAITLQKRASYEAAVMAANTVTVSSQYLYDIYSKRHPDVRLIRNAIDLAPYQPRRQARMVTIGWGGATPWRSGDIETLSPWFAPFVRTRGLLVHHVGHIDGAVTFAELAGLDPDTVSTSKMVNIYDYPGAIARSMDIGVVPLNDIPFNRAKSFLKGMEYTAAGIPFVAQGLHEYRLLAEDGIGYVAGTPGEWMDALSSLIALSPQRRERLVSGWRKALVARHDYTLRAAEWRDALKIPSGAL